MKNVQLKKGDKVELTIASLAPGGEGVSRDLGVPVFVNRVAVGDRVLVEIFDRRRDFARGKVVDLLTPSKDRVEPPCKLFKVCGGCQWQHLSYPAQLKAKEEIIRQSLQHIGAMPVPVVREATGAERQLFYRNKVQFPVRQPHGSTRILAGYYEQDSHRLVNVKHCPIQPARLDEMLAEAKASCEKFGISAYNEETGKGLLRFINARFSEADGEVLVTLVCNCPRDEMPRIVQEAAHDLKAKVPHITGICANFNTSPGNRILGEETNCLIGKPYIEEVLRTDRVDYPRKLQEGLRFVLSSESFFQINTAQTIKLLEQVSGFVDKFVSTSSEKTMIDAYAGVGAIALWLAASFKRVIAIEENRRAVNDGHKNLEKNAIDNVEFHCGQVEEVLPNLAENGLNAHLIVVDPPRKGCSQEALAAMARMAPTTIIYVSCNPTTLARDLRILATSGYKTEEVLPVDLFPQTYHIESVAVLTRQVGNDQVSDVEKTPMPEGGSAA